MTSRDKLRESLRSSNSLRQGISLTNEDLFLLEYIRDRAVNASIVRNYNKTVEHIRSFTEKLLSQRLTVNTAKLGAVAAREISRMSISGRVIVTVKVTANGSSYFIPKSRIHEIPHPYQFIKNKGMNISLVIAEETADPQKPNEIIPLFFMVGCEWCPTSIDGHDPVRNHQHGENVIDLRGYVLINSDKGGCTPKYFFAHEKVAHNNISTVQNDKGVYVTTLKTQDDKNNSVETKLYKKKSDGQEDVYYLESTCFREPLRVNDLFSDIAETLNKIANESNGRLYNMNMDVLVDKIMKNVAGDKLMNFIIYDHTPNKETVFDLMTENDERLDTKTKLIFREVNSRMDYYTENFVRLYTPGTFKEFMINVIFPSIAPSDLSSLESKYNAYIGKAVLLMRMLVWNILTESQILEPTDRNDVGRKVYMTADQVIRRDITRDNGAILRNREEGSGKVAYNPKADANKGETKVIEAFDMTNMFNAIAQLTSLNTPRSSHSKRMGPRDVTCSQNGFVCPSETPSTDKVGLVTHMACTAAFSCYKDPKIVEKIVNNLILPTSPRVFTNIFSSQVDMQIGGRVFRSLNASSSTEQKLLSINSIPYAMITEEQYLEIRKTIKRTPDTMDVVVLRETIKVNKAAEKLINLSYNIICDSGRMYRPLYRVDRLMELELLAPGALEEEHKKHQNFEHFVRMGIVELVFPSEMENSSVCMTRSELVKHLSEKESAKRALPGLHQSLKEKKAAFEEARKKLEAPTDSPQTTLQTSRAEKHLAVLEKHYREAEIMIMKMNLAAETEYTYCEIDPYTIFGVVSSCSPMFNHNPGNRALHQSAMDKSLLSIISSNQNMITESSAKKLHTTSQCVVTTKTNEFYSRYVKNGENAIMGINIGTHNQEDAILIQESFAKSIISERVTFHEFIIEQGEVEGIPDVEGKRDLFMKNPRFHAIDMDTGTPHVKSILKEGDCIFTKYIKETTETDPETGEEIDKYTPKSFYVQTGKEGYVSKVTTQRLQTQIVVQIVLATMKTIDYGDKVSTRYSQKSVVGGIIKDSDMFYIDDPTSPLHGTALNAFFSPMSITSRGTAGLLLEMMLGNLGVATGKVQDASAFTVNRDRMINVNDQLIKLGFKPWCVEKVFNPVTQTHMYTMVGVVHMRVLKHTAVDKQKACGMINYRMDLMNRQPAKGGPTGGSRLGYMDSNTLFGQNAAKLVNILYKEQSSEVVVNVCDTCQHLNDRCNRDTLTAVDVYAIDHCSRCGEKTLREVSTTYSLVMIHNYLLSVGVKLDIFTS